MTGQKLQQLVGTAKIRFSGRRTFGVAEVEGVWDVEEVLDAAAESELLV